MVEFGEQLRRSREAKGMTQQSLAEQLYVTRQSVSRWECGDRYPDLITTKQISQMLEVSLDDLLSGKEMTKVVERNPVVENKVANNIMIVLYAFVVLSYLITVIDLLIRIPSMFNGTMNAGSICYSVIQSFGLIISIAVFIYGLIYAVRGMLTPKRMGGVLIVFFVAACIVQMDYIGITTLQTGAGGVIWNWRAIAVICSFDILPNIVAAVAAYFFFIKGDSSKKWICFIVVNSVLGIIRSIYTYVTMIVLMAPYSDQFLSMNIPKNMVMAIAIDGLILYQTCVLYKKRVAAVEIVQRTVNE